MENLTKNPVSLTISAAGHIASELSKSQARGEHVVGLKLGVKKSGCSGYAYTIDWLKSDAEVNQYHVFKSHDVDIYVDKASYDIISGTEVDYVQQGISRVMVFRNPHAVAECGCGESFTVDQDKA